MYSSYFLYSVQRKRGICPGIACVGSSSVDVSHVVALLRAETVAIFSLSVWAAAFSSSFSIVSDFGFNNYEAVVKRWSGSAALKSFRSKSHPAKFLS